MEMKLIERAQSYLSRIAIKSGGQSYTYQDLLETSGQVAHHLLGGRSDLGEARIAFLVNPSFDYVCLQWGIWRAHNGACRIPFVAFRLANA